jgi:hypothetical protein
MELKGRKNNDVYHLHSSFVHLPTTDMAHQYRLYGLYLGKQIYLMELCTVGALEN